VSRSGVGFPGVRLQRGSGKDPAEELQGAAAGALFHVSKNGIAPPLETPRLDVGDVGG
jgi:hypothetical protein